MNAVDLALLGSGLFFLCGLLTGLWKYRCISRSADAQAPVYVDVCHRASLMYAFACLVLMEFAERSTWADRVNQFAVAIPIFFFAAAIATYIVHGALRDTDNQLRRPHVLGTGHVHGAAVGVFMVLLTAGEIGGFAVLFAGWMRGL
jgi:hypothetical protein